MHDNRLRASDADRDTVIQILSKAYGEGRITAGEHTERVDAALAAKTFGDLAPLTVDLVPPDPRSTPPPRTSPPAPFSGGSGIELPVEVITATLSNQERAGDWLVPRRLRVNALLATVSLDLTRARVPAQTLDIDCSMIMSNLKLRVPLGTRVQDETRRILAENSTKRIGPFSDHAPLIRLTGTSVFSEVKVRGPRGRHLLDYLGF